MSFEPGARLGQYEILSRIGVGGMAEVYRARDIRLGRTVAIKVITSTTSDPIARERFDREARSLAALSHPHVCRVHQYGEHEDQPFLVMEFLEGQTLAQRVAASGTLPLAEALRHAREIADGLQAAHTAGIIHRDLKPDNVMLTAGGVKLLDFGIARWTNDLASLATTRSSFTTVGTILGTVAYMSPEVLEGNPADVRSDIWAFGTVLYEMVTGTHAFTGASRASIIAAIMTAQVAPPSTHNPAVPPAVDWVIDRCLRKTPAERFATITEVIAALSDVTHDVDANASRGTIDSTPPKRRRIRFAITFGISFTVGLYLLLMVGSPVRILYKAPIPMTEWTDMKLSAAQTVDARPALSEQFVIEQADAGVFLRTIDGRYAFDNKGIIDFRDQDRSYFILQSRGLGQVRLRSPAADSWIGVDADGRLIMSSTPLVFTVSATQPNR